MIDLVDRTDTSITVNIVKPTGNEQELEYKFKIEGDGVMSTSEHDCTGASCSDSNLRPGRPYKISARACIKENPATCGAMSNSFTFYTVPESKPLFLKRSCHPELILTFHLAPSDVTAVTVSTSSIAATVSQAADVTGVDHYTVQIKDHTEKNCIANPNALSCTIGALSPATQYTVQVEACLGEHSDIKPCSTVKVGGQVWTTPGRKY